MSKYINIYVHINKCQIQRIQEFWEMICEAIVFYRQKSIYRYKNYLLIVFTMSEVAQICL